MLVIQGSQLSRTAARWHAQPRLVQGAATGVSADAAGSIPRYGITRRMTLGLLTRICAMLKLES